MADCIPAQGVHHFRLTVSNVERAVKFYTDVLGFKKLMDLNPGAFLSNGQVGIGIGPHPEPGRAMPGDRFDENRIGLDHLSFGVASRPISSTPSACLTHGVSRTQRFGISGRPLGSAFSSFATLTTSSSSSAPHALPERRRTAGGCFDIPMRCSRCQHDNPPGLKFCGECGTPLMRACPSCGAANTPTQKFCGECGTGLAATPTLGEARVPESYTPRHLAEKILASRTAIEGERKPVTVLFCDVVSSTVLAETLGPEGMHALLNGFFETALAEVHRYEGTINQFLGDGFMALFGAPLAHEDHARRAVLAALAITRAVAERPLEAEPGRPVPLKLRLGLHTGFVVVGAIGDNLRMDYTAVGDTTHLAARLQQLAEPGAIVISEATARLVRGYVALDTRGEVEVRGRSAPVTIHLVTGRGPRRSPLEDPAERKLSHFVGRGRELGALKELLAEVEAARGQVVGIVGEPGVGKSRLLLEFQSTLAGRRVTYLEGRCLSFGSAIPFLPVLDIVRNACGLTEADPPETMIEKVQVTLADVGMDATAGLPFLLHLLGVKEPSEHATESLAGLSPESIKARTFEILRQMSLRASRRRPVILVVEDLHWIDRTSEEYLASLVESLPGMPVMLLTTYRPGYRPAWMDKSYTTQLSLARLTPTDSLTIVRSVMPEAGLGDPLAKMILDKAEGNPFFLEELARAVGDQGLSRPGLSVPDP